MKNPFASRFSNLLHVFAGMTALFTLLFIFTGCSPEEPVYPTTLENARFEKKIPCEVALERGMKRIDYVSGKSGQTMLFMLRNKGLRPVTIDEWYMNETENIRLFYAPCEKGKSGEVKEKDWIQGWPEKPKKGSPELAKGRHMPIQLNPNNAAVLEVPMKFLKKFPMKGKQKVNLAIYAELSLNTVSAKSPVFEIEVRPMVKGVQFEKNETTQE